MECIAVETYFASAGDTQTLITKDIRERRNIGIPLYFGAPTTFEFGCFATAKYTLLNHHDYYFSTSRIKEKTHITPIKN